MYGARSLSILHIQCAEQQLPAVDMKYYTLPPDQLDPLTHDKLIQKRASLPEERKLSFIKAITISLGVPDFQHALVRFIYVGTEESVLISKVS